MTTLAAMQESTDTGTDSEAESPAAPRPASDTTAAPAGDSMLDGFESDLDDVAAALDALDADDLDGAEALAAGLEAEGATDPGADAAAAAPPADDTRPPAGYE